MRIIDPFDYLGDRAPAAKAMALRSDSAMFIRLRIGQQLAEIEDNPEHPFARGYRMGLRVAYLAAGGLCDGSEQDWVRIVEEHRG